MGYPMTYSRVIHRNRLSKGDYRDEKVPDWFASGATVYWDAVSIEPGQLLAFARTLLEHQNAAAQSYNGKVAMLAGDLRRLEADTVDEGVVCQDIARRVGIEPDVVAAVLKEWMSL